MEAACAQGQAVCGHRWTVAQGQTLFLPVAELGSTARQIPHRLSAGEPAFYSTSLWLSIARSYQGLGEKDCTVLAVLARRSLPGLVGLPVIFKLAVGERCGPLRVWFISGGCSATFLGPTCMWRSIYGVTQPVSRAAAFWVPGCMEVVLPIYQHSASFVMCGKHCILFPQRRAFRRSERRYSHQGSPVSEVRRVFNRAETSTAVSGGRSPTAEARSLYRPHSRWKPDY
ncbi:hypothetical protein NDU88_011648 [Pleurodeles waltl]|uniref:Uncharacterized protein n=1 Tax=Pleurodeles waltl TaxID=8319 RepID=A0AAV7Q3X1_PLEWA|nr:hypothetical protein NDU88_011648 [Pleurodeles waltl]